MSYYYLKGDKVKIKLSDRIISALLAIILLCCAAAIVAQLFFGVQVVEKVGNIFKTPDQLLHKIILIGTFVIILLFAVYCLSVLFRHRKPKSRFLSQTTDGGELDISLEALNNLVTRCIDQHPEITAEKVILQNEKNSLSVRIIGKVAGGISIPLTVSQLQKQIKQYVTACSGVEVREVKVTVRTSGEDAKDAPFAIEAPAAVPKLKASREEEIRSAGTEEETPVIVPEAVRINVTEETENPPAELPPTPEDDTVNDDRPLHQRIFSQPEELCFVPGPDENTQDKSETGETEEKQSFYDEPVEEEKEQPDETDKDTDLVNQ